MPKMKVSPVRKQADIVMKNIIMAGAEGNCRSDRKIAEKAHIPSSTFGERRNNPLSLRLSELIFIAETFGKPLEWFMQDHSKS